MNMNPKTTVNTSLRGRVHISSLVATSILLIAAFGCTKLPPGTTPWQDDSPEKAAGAAAKPGPTQVRTGGDGFALGDVEKATLAPQRFVDRVSEHLRAEHTFAARRCVERFPDAALAVFRDPTSVKASRDALLWIAAAHDRQGSRGDAPGWANVFRDRAAQPKRYANYDEKRRQFMTHVQNGRAREALGLGLAAPQGAPARVLQFDVQHLTGIALMLDNRPQEAVAAFQQALKSAGDSRPYESVNVLLLLSDAQRRAGDAAAAGQTWVAAAELCTDLAAGNAPVADPILMERIAYLRPADAPWPPAAQQRLNDLAARMGIVVPASPLESTSTLSKTTSDEAALWTVIGQWRLAREESQAALVAFKRAESMTSGPLAAAQLHLAQSRALIRLGQAPAASAMLINLAGQSDPQIAHPAMALLGTLKLRDGGIQQGFNLLRRAVEEDASLAWPERTQAEADLGLAYLLAGDEPTGLRWLHGAQQSFEASGQRDELAQCLENEAGYLEQFKKGDLAKAVRGRLASIQAE
jgi:tetratricopeptide (TPR) repeat protein